MLEFVMDLDDILCMFACPTLDVDRERGRSSPFDRYSWAIAYQLGLQELGVLLTLRHV